MRLSTYSLTRTRATVRALLLFFLLFEFCEAILNTSIPNYVDVYKPIDYAVIGQQKSGTSTLWNVLTANPVVKSVGQGKESFFFSGEHPRTTLCDNLLEDFQSQVAVQRLRFNRTDLLVGDWSATHFSCACCPAALRTLNPGLKVVIVLRDPVQRALSRFVEQKRNFKMPLHNQVSNLTFAEFVRLEATALEACVARAAPLRQSRPQPASSYAAASAGWGSRSGSGSIASTQQQQLPLGGQLRGLRGQEPLAGWGAGLDMGRWMEMQCFSRSNILGWSVYDVFLENYLAYFPQEQVLVLYTDDLSSQPLESFRRVEAFLGAPPYKYDAAVVSLVFNSRECYNWRCAKKKGEIKPQVDLPSGTDDGQQQAAAAALRDGPFSQAMSRLVDLYRPHMQRLFEWADQGRIAPPPEAWRKMYG